MLHGCSSRRRRSLDDILASCQRQPKRRGQHGCIHWHTGTRGAQRTMILSNVSRTRRAAALFQTAMAVGSLMSGSPDMRWEVRKCRESKAGSDRLWAGPSSHLSGQSSSRLFCCAKEVFERKDAEEEMGLDVEEGRNVRTKRKRLERSFIRFQSLRLQRANRRISRTTWRGAAIIR